MMSTTTPTFSSSSFLSRWFPWRGEDKKFKLKFQALNVGFKVRETVVTVHLLSPVCLDLLSLVNRLLPVLDGTFGQPSNSSCNLYESVINHSE
ncbi:hypothetical protein V6N13_126650 [Hibiscus sabdariffa]